MINRRHEDFDLGRKSSHTPDGFRDARHDAYGRDAQHFLDRLGHAAHSGHELHQHGFPHVDLHHAAGHAPHGKHEAHTSDSHRGHHENAHHKHHQGSHHHQYHEEHAAGHSRKHEEADTVSGADVPTKQPAKDTDVKVKADSGERGAGQATSDKQAPKVGKEDFTDRLVHGVASTEGAVHANGDLKFHEFTPNDAGAGVSVGIKQWNQKKGDLNELMADWHKANPQKFEQLFGRTPNPETHPGKFESWVKHAPFAGSLRDSMQEALHDPEFQKVQVENVKGWINKEVNKAVSHGLKTEREIATFVDLANQYGDGGARRALRYGGHSTDQSANMEHSVRAAKYRGRYHTLSEQFSTHPAEI